MNTIEEKSTNRECAMMKKKEAEKKLMNPKTGTVATEQEWRTDFESMSAEEWGSVAFEDAGLVEVEWREDTWVEA